MTETIEAKPRPNLEYRRIGGELTTEQIIKYFIFLISK